MKLLPIALRLLAIIKNRKAMVITDSKTIREVQAEFQQKFPYLRIQFYMNPHKAGEGSQVSEQLPIDKTIGEVRKKHEEGDFKIDETMKVSDFENNIYKKFGLSVQVFRKSGSIWMQTTSTDDWTLAEQNRKGGSSEKAFIEKYGS